MSQPLTKKDLQITKEDLSAAIERIERGMAASTREILSCFYKNQEVKNRRFDAMDKRFDAIIDRLDGMVTKT